MTQVVDNLCALKTLTDESLASKATSASTDSNGVIKLDVEHAFVEDDPRTWSHTRKNVILLIISGGSMIAGLCVNIQNPANSQIQQELHTTASYISLSLSLFVLVQGIFPLMWSALSEIKGRKLVYLLSVLLFIVGSASAAISKYIRLFIGMRLLQAVGSSAVMAIGAATLADIYEPHQRGSVLGIYYTAPLLGPSIGPVLGGGLAQISNWRAIFWFLAILGVIIFLAFLFLFKDTFRKERSLMYQNVLKRRAHERILAQEGNTMLSEPPVDKEMTLDGINPTSAPQTPRDEVEAQPAAPALDMKEIKLSFTDINPIPPILRVLSRKNNLCVLIPSGLLFGFNFSLAYTCARTLSLRYDYDAMKTGLVLLSFGIGCILGSIFGGRWSDRTLARLKAANGGISYPEMRLESTKFAMWCFSPSVVGYAWVCQKNVHVAAICVTLFLSGFCCLWIFSSTLTYIVDANVGRSSSAVATNSLIRGLAAFVAAEIAVPLQNAIGDGGLYTLWAGLLLLSELMILLVLWNGKQWREASIEAEQRRSAS